MCFGTRPTSGSINSKRALNDSHSDVSVKNTSKTNQSAATIALVMCHTANVSKMLMNKCEKGKAQETYK